jgi:hypothetical protein
MILIHLLVAKQPLAKKQKLGPIARQSELSKLACNYLPKDSKTTGVEDDEYLTIAKVWKNKLHPIQFKIAEKSINDIIFEADIGTLH